MANVINITSGLSTAFTRSEAYNAYTNDVRGYKVLSPEEEQKLLKEYVSCKNEKRKLEIRDALLLANQRFIIAAAKQYCQRDTELFLNLLGEANIGFIEAIEKYDFKKIKHDVRLYSWAAWFVRRQINIYMYNQNPMVKQSNNSITHYRLVKVRNTLSQELQREPSEEEVLEYLQKEHDVDIKDVRDVINVRVSSVDTYSDDDEAFNPTLAAFNDATASNNSVEKIDEQNHTKMLIKKGLSGLSEKEKQVIIMMYGLEAPYIESSMSTIASKFGFSEERIRQLHIAALKKMALKIKRVAKNT